jgi:hypothetical protein
MAAASSSRVGLLLAEGLVAQLRLESIPAVLRKISCTARDGERYAFEGMLADSGC